MINKTQTRLPEAMFVAFNPLRDAQGDEPALEWEANKLGSWVGFEQSAR